MPTLIVPDLHVVMCCVLCPVTCARCWAAMCSDNASANFTATPSQLAQP